LARRKKSCGLIKQTKQFLEFVSPPDNSLIAAGSRKGSLYVLDRSGNLLWKYKTKPEEALVSASISADGSMLAIGSTDNKIYLSDIKEFQ